MVSANSNVTNDNCVERRTINYVPIGELSAGRQAATSPRKNISRCKGCSSRSVELLGFGGHLIDAVDAPFIVVWVDSAEITVATPIGVNPSL